MAKLFIDNKAYEVQSGKNMLESCLSLGFDLPYFCWHPALGSVGACRQCAVKVYKDENDKKGRLVMSCMEPVTDNQRISVEDPEAKEFRANIVESLMTNHPHDCAICDEGGSCHLQDMTVMTGHNYRRYNYKKRTYKNQYLGPFINHEMNRCIQCYRCVRFYKEYAGGDDLDVFASRNNVYFGRAEEGVLENEFSGNLSEVCPTGVFTDKTLKEHYTRKWDLTMAPSVCNHCSLGCNIIAGERYGELRVIMNRYHEDVNGYFICDRGRFGTQYVNATDRIRQPDVSKVATTEDRDGLRTVGGLIAASKKIIGIGSARASLQSNFVLKTLVGKDNFYHGVSDSAYDLELLGLKILKEGAVPSGTMKDIEVADAVLILGEDLTNTAPRLALAVRQAAKQEFMPMVKATGIAPWNDAAVREIIQDKKGSVFVATVNETKLDNVARSTYRGVAEDIGRFGLAIAHILDPASPEVKDLTEQDLALVRSIAESLSKAQRPVIISGVSCENEGVLKAAANIAWALERKNKNTRLTLTFHECNSLGLSMLGGHRLTSAFDAVLNKHADTVIVMENDLYRHAPKNVVDEFIKGCKHIIVMDCMPNATTEKASVLIPAGTFAESDGILVNNEGRAQRCFQLYEPKNSVRESWRWLLGLGEIMNHKTLMQWKNFEDVTNAINEQEPLLKGIKDVTPPSDFRIAGQRIPREPHRYSGRTSMNAHINVSEEKPPKDQDSSLSYTMEGYAGMAPSTMIPFFWSPGWNSVQSVNKYQQEVGGALRGGNPGVRLLHPASTPAKYFTAVPEKYRPMPNRLWVVPLDHIFGSDELSAKSKPLTERIPKPYLLVSGASKDELNLKDGDQISFTIGPVLYTLPVKLNDSLPKGVAALPCGLDGIPYAEVPAWGHVKETRATANAPLANEKNSVMK
jgi:NADH-quinone oxidoreductase subunit G